MPLLPPSIIGTVSPILADACTHAQLNTLFMFAGYPGDSPEGNKIEKCRNWLPPRQQRERRHAHDVRPSHWSPKLYRVHLLPIPRLRPVGRTGRGVKRCRVMDGLTVGTDGNRIFASLMHISSVEDVDELSASSRCSTLCLGMMPPQVIKRLIRRRGPLKLR